MSAHVACRQILAIDPLQSDVLHQLRYVVPQRRLPEKMNDTRRTRNVPLPFVDSVMQYCQALGLDTEESWSPNN